jgi:hypothetical protein
MSSPDNKQPDKHPEIPTDADMARSDMQEYATAIEPHYADIRRELGAKSIEHVDIANKQYEIREAHANTSLINDFAGALPDVESIHSRICFAANDSAEARIIQTNTIWDRYGPLYVVGSRFYESPKWTELLMIRPKTDNRSRLEKVIVNTEVYKGNKEAAEMRENDSFGRDMSEMVHTSTGKLIVDKNTPGTVKLGKTKTSVYWYAFMPLPDRDTPRTLEDTVTNDVMRSFNVYEHLYKLAAAFQKTEALDSLLAERAEVERQLQSETTPDTDS